MTQSTRNSAWLAAIGIHGLLCSSGCVGTPSRLTRPGLARSASPSSLQLTVGETRPLMDRLENSIHGPRRWLTNRLGISDESIQSEDQARRDAVAQSKSFLMANGIEDIYLDIHRYAPTQQWARLRDNTLIGPGWKYTGGAIQWAADSLLPGRVLHSDGYNPFTNTLSINSSDSASAVYAAASAKMYRKQWSPGIYWGMQFVTGVPVLQHVITAKNAIEYSKAKSSPELTKEISGLAVIEIAAEVGSEFIPF